MARFRLEDSCITEEFGQLEACLVTLAAVVGQRAITLLNGERAVN